MLAMVTASSVEFPSLVGDFSFNLITKRSFLEHGKASHLEQTAFAKRREFREYFLGKKY